MAGYEVPIKPGYVKKDTVRVEEQRITTSRRPSVDHTFKEDYTAAITLKLGEESIHVYSKGNDLGVDRDYMSQSKGQKLLRLAKILGTIMKSEIQSIRGKGASVIVYKGLPNEADIAATQAASEFEAAIQAYDSAMQVSQPKVTPVRQDNFVVTQKGAEKVATLDGIVLA